MNYRSEHTEMPRHIAPNANAFSAVAPDVDCPVAIRGGPRCRAVPQIGRQLGNQRRASQCSRDSDWEFEPNDKRKSELPGRRVTRIGEAYASRFLAPNSEVELHEPAFDDDRCGSPHALVSAKSPMKQLQTDAAASLTRAWSIDTIAVTRKLSRKSPLCGFETGISRIYERLARQLLAELAGLIVDLAIFRRKSPVGGVVNNSNACKRRVHSSGIPALCRPTK